MAVAFDAVGPSASGTKFTTATAGTPATWTHVNSAAGNALLVGITIVSGTANTITSVSYGATQGGATALSFLGYVPSNNVGGGGVALYGKAGGLPAGTNTVYVVASEAGNHNAGSVSLTGAGSLGAPQTSYGYSTGPLNSASFATTTGGMLAGAWCFGDMGVAWAAAGGSTIRWSDQNSSSSGSDNGCMATLASTGSALAIGVGVGAYNDYWGCVAVEVLSGAAPKTVTPPAPAGTGTAPAPQVEIGGEISVGLSDAGAAADAIGGIGGPFIAGKAGTGASSYFVNQAGQPVLGVKEDCWDIISSAGRYSSGDWQGDMDTYLETRAAQGYSIVQCAAMGDDHIGSATGTGSTWDGVAPFTTAYSVLNNTYWTRVDYLIDKAATAGITIALNTLFTYSLAAPGHVMYGINSGNNPQDFGAALGSRYKAKPNLMWHFADDYDGESWPAVFSGVITGIRGAGDTHLASIENMATGSTCRYNMADATYSSPLSWGSTYASYDWCYYYAETYNAVEFAYAEPNPILVMWCDGMYWGEVAGGTQGNNDALRMCIWWALSSAARGVNITDNNVWRWESGALAALTGDGPMFTAWAGHIRSYLTSLTGWNTLLPDTSSVLVTGGRGTRAGYNAAAGQGYISANRYVTASRTADKRLAVIYLPAHTAITIDETAMIAGYTATWVDPASCDTTPATPGTSYDSAGQGVNSANSYDWVLVLQSATAGLQVTTAALPDATAGTAYSQTLAATGGTEPYAWEIDSGTLPPGLGLS